MFYNYLYYLNNYLQLSNFCNEQDREVFFCTSDTALY